MHEMLALLINKSQTVIGQSDAHWFTETKVSKSMVRVHDQRSNFKMVSRLDKYTSCIFIILTLAPPFIYRPKLLHLDRTTSTKAEARPTWVSQDLRLGRFHGCTISCHVVQFRITYHFV